MDWFRGLRKNSRSTRQRTSAAKAGRERKPVIAALKRCATQNQECYRVFQRSVKTTLIPGAFRGPEGPLFHDDNKFVSFSAAC